MLVGVCGSLEWVWPIGQSNFHIHSRKLIPNESCFDFFNFLQLFCKEEKSGWHFESWERATANYRTFIEARYRTDFKNTSSKINYDKWTSNHGKLPDQGLVEKGQRKSPDSLKLLGTFHSLIQPNVIRKQGSWDLIPTTSKWFFSVGFFSSSFLIFFTMVLFGQRCLPCGPS